MKNYGIDLDRQKADELDTDWVFGATSKPCLTDIPESDRLEYLPKGEVQFGLEDFMDCATRGPLNILELKFNWLLRNNKLLPELKDWLFDNGYLSGNCIEFSDRFIAIKSGTTRIGNSLKGPIDTIYRYGLVPKKLLPKANTMTWADYHDKSKITPTIEKLGLEFKKRFTINYERVYSIHTKELLKDDLVNVAGNAWPIPVNGEYPKNNGSINHCFICVKNPAYIIYDNYFDNVDGDFIKKLAGDYIFYEYGYRIYISSQQVPKNWWDIFTAWFKPNPVKGFDVDLKYGMEHPDVVRLQKLLNSDSDTAVAIQGVGSIGNETNYFGLLTLDALVRFQKKNLIEPANGYLGPITRAFINGKIMIPSEQLYKTAKAHLGQNLAPGNEVLGCAISLSAIYNRAFPEKPPLRFVNTGEWYDWLEKNAQKLDKPEPNCIIISTTRLAPPDSPLEHGHIGIVGRIKSPDGSYYVMSNNSLRKIWDTYFTVDKWRIFYTEYGRIPTGYYKLT